MKKLYRLSLLAAVCCGFVMASCKKDEQPVIKDLKINFDMESYDIKPGETLKIDFTVAEAGDAELTATVASSDETDYPATVSDIKSAAGVITVTAPELILTAKDITLTIDVKEVSGTRTAKATVTVVAGESQVTAAPGKANSFIVPPGALFRFQAFEGNSDAAVAFASADLVWQDVKGLVKQIMPNTADKIILVQLNPEISGNALVAAKDADGVILWSWHLWVADYNPEAKPMSWTSSGDTPVTYVYMDRYVGATSNTPGQESSHGLFYNWGRKDPMALPNMENGLREFYDMDGEVVERIIGKNEATESNIPESIKKPTTHFVGASANNYSWAAATRAMLATDEFTDLWGGNTGNKSKYDPCPYGWKVIPAAAWYFMSDTAVEKIKVFADGVAEPANKDLLGFKYKVGEDEFWFPSAGEIAVAGSPLANGVGSNWPCGKAWSATADVPNVRGFGTAVSPTSVSPGGSYSHNYNLPIRCIKE